jgi:hypothetical protein
MLGDKYHFFHGLLMLSWWFYIIYLSFMSGRWAFYAVISSDIDATEPVSWREGVDNEFLLFICKRWVASVVLI